MAGEPLAKKTLKYLGVHKTYAEFLQNDSQQHEPGTSEYFKQHLEYPRLWKHQLVAEQQALGRGLLHMVYMVPLHNGDELVFGVHRETVFEGSMVEKSFFVKVDLSEIENLPGPDRAFKGAWYLRKILILV